jgi:hypothetical protein
MTHFIGAVIAPPNAGTIELKPTKYPDLYGADAQEAHPSKELEEYLEQALQPFDENIPEPVPYVNDSDWEGTLARAKKWGADPQNTDPDTPMADEGPEAWLRWYDSEWKPDGNGGFVSYSTYNRLSKWDWWVIGGRWEQMYRERQGETVQGMLDSLAGYREALSDPELVARAQAVAERNEAAEKAYYGSYALGEEVRKVADKNWEDARAALRAEPAYMPWWFPYSIVHPVDEEGTTTWTEKGSMGWWGMHSDTHDDEAWLDKLEEVLKSVPPTSTVWYIDFHI